MDHCAHRRESVGIEDIPPHVQQAVIAQLFPVVGRVDDQRVVQLASRGQSIQQHADAGVDV